MSSIQEQEYVARCRHKSFAVLTVIVAVISACNHRNDPMTGLDDGQPAMPIVIRFISLKDLDQPGRYRGEFIFENQSLRPALVAVNHPLPRIDGPKINGLGVVEIDGSDDSAFMVAFDPNISILQVDGSWHPVHRFTHGFGAAVAIVHPQVRVRLLADFVIPLEYEGDLTVKLLVGAHYSSEPFAVSRQTGRQSPPEAP